LANDHNLNLHFLDDKVIFPSKEGKLKISFKD